MALLALVLGGTGARGAERDALTACGMDRAAAGMAAEAVRAVDGRSFILADGRELVLAGIEAPAHGRAALDALIRGQSVVLRPDVEARDRYGRMRVYATVAGTDRLIQQDLLAQGLARVAVRAGAAACAAALLAAEQPARAERRGLWADPILGLQPASNGRSLAAAHGRFAVAAGRIVSVRERGGTIYLNFGRRWSEALTVTIARRDARRFAAAGLEPQRLENRDVVVRGWIELRNGPRIAASRPEQIVLSEAR